MRRDVYSGYLKLYGEEHEETLQRQQLREHLLRQRFEEAKQLMRKNDAGARVLGESNELTLRMRGNYAAALSPDTAATLDDLREAVTTLEDAANGSRGACSGARTLS